MRKIFLAALVAANPILCFALDAELEKLRATMETSKKKYFEMRKSADADMAFSFAFEALVSPKKEIREEIAKFLMPYLERRCIAVEHFEKIGWGKLDAKGRGLYLWCVAGQRTWSIVDGHGGNPLTAEEQVQLWQKAASEATALPFLKEIAATTYQFRGTSMPPISLGERLGPSDRSTLARRFLSAFKDCKSKSESHAVAWMIIDLYIDTEDTAVAEWYSNEANAELRKLFLEVVLRIYRPQSEKDADREAEVRSSAKEMLAKRSKLFELIGSLGKNEFDDASVQISKELLEAIRQK